jgi:Domain of unknown function (DUF4275)
MKPEDPVIDQLRDQKIEFELVSSGYDPSNQSAISLTVRKWKDKFIGDHKAPDMDRHMWHIFSFEKMDCSNGDSAKKELMNQYASDILIFNERQQFLIRCSRALPIIEMNDFSDDIYLCHHNMKWTYVIPHEIPDIGPFFSKGIN